MRAQLIGLLFASIAVAGLAQPASSPEPFATEIRAFVDADRATPPKACSLLFVGSSSIRLWQSLATDMSPHRVINRGFGGSTIADVNRYFDQVVKPYRPRAIFFYAGENDIAAGKSAADVRSEFERFLQRKDRVLGRTPVYFISLKPSKARFSQLRQQSEVNAAVRQLAKKRRDLHFVDVASPMLHAGRPRDIFQEDALHLTDAGYRIWTRVIRPLARKAARRKCS